MQTIEHGDCLHSLEAALGFLSRGQEADGSWPDFVVSPTAEGREWTTAYVGWCLNHLQEGHELPLIPLLDKARLFLSRSRRAHGGWGFYPRAPIDADSTAYALLFLLPGAVPGRPDFKREEQVLLDHRKEDGGFATFHRDNLTPYPGTSGYYASTPCVTASSALALLQLSHDGNWPILNQAATYLFRRQHPRGYWDSFWWERGIYSTFMVTHFLRQLRLGGPQLRKTAQWLREIQESSGCWRGERVERGIPFLTAVALETQLLLGASVSSRSIRAGLAWLLKTQRPDGSWDSFPIMKVPCPEQPWKGGNLHGGEVVPGNRRNFVTAAVVSFLSRFLFTETRVQDPRENRRWLAGYCPPSFSGLSEDAESLSVDVSLEAEIEMVMDQFSHYVRGLPPNLQALTASSPRWKERGPGLSHYLPFWLNQEFARGALLEEARQMALANRFGQVFCLLRDGIADGHAGGKPEILFLLDALFFQFVHRYQNLFRASHPFWNLFENYWLEYLEALAREKVRHEGSVSPYTHEDFTWLGRKFSPIKICCAGMALLADRREEIPRFSQMIEYLQTGYQLLDDLKDWREDLEKGNHTFPLTLALLCNKMEKRGPPLTPEGMEELLWSRGLAVEVYEKAVDFLSRSLAEIAHLSLEPLKTWIQRIQQDARQEVEKIKGDRERNRRFPQLEVFSHNGHRFVFNVSTSALFEIDEKAASILHQVTQGSGKPELPEQEEVLRELRIAGVFSSPPATKGESTPALTTLYVNPSGHCNLGCLYCFAKGAGKTKSRRSMSRDIGEKAVDLLLRESRGSRAVKLVFFGSEPLLNSDLVIHLIHYGRHQSELQGKEIRFDIVTNGTVLSPEMKELFRREDVSIQVSLDGPPHVQNRLRPSLKGEGTYTSVLENIRELQRRGIGRIGIHATLFSLTPSPLEILKHLSSLGIGAIGMEYLAPTQERRRVWSDADLPLMKRAQEEVAEYFFLSLREGRLVPYANILKPLVRLYRGDRHLYPCGAGTSIAAVTPEGILYPCSRFSEEPVLAVGDVLAGFDRERLSPYIHNTVDQKEPCRTCWARYLCGGGCLFNNLLVNGDMTRPDPHECARKKHHFQVTTRLFVRIRQELPDLVKTMEREDTLSSLIEPERWPQ